MKVEKFVETKKKDQKIFIFAFPTYFPYFHAFMDKKKQGGVEDKPDSDGSPILKTKSAP